MQVCAASRAGACFCSPPANAQNTHSTAATATLEGIVLMLIHLPQTAEKWESVTLRKQNDASQTTDMYCRNIILNLLHLRSG